MAGSVRPRLSRGLRDLLPSRMIVRQRMIDTIRGVYERYGFVPLDTPAIEYLDVLTGSDAGEDAAGQIFRVVNPEEEALGLRFDLTVPLARVVAQYRDLPRPFRRYQVASVWRADKPDPGRYREFTQFDIDSVGVRSELADTEILAAMCDTLDALGVTRYRVRFSSRGVLEALLDVAGISSQRGRDVFRVIDKLDKIGPEKVRLELTVGYTDASGDVIRGLGLDDATVGVIERFLAIGGETRSEVLDALTDFFSGAERAREPIEGLRRIDGHLTALGYGSDRVAIDPSIARGLGYYTGPVFEAVLLDAPQFGSVFGGGRYDGLVRRFSGEDVPAVGASIGVDRLLAALEHTGAIAARPSTAAVLVTRMDPALEREYLAITFALRRAGIAAELYVGHHKRVGKQLRYADQLDIPIAVIVGSDEHERGVVTLKDMEIGRRQAQAIARREDWVAARPGQREVARADLVAEVRRMLADIARGDAT